MIKASLKKVMFFLAVAGLCQAGVQAPVLAGMIETNEIVATAEVQQKRQEIRGFAAREEVARQLESYGVDPAQLDERISSMTDAEIQQFHANLDELPVGQDALGTVVLILLIFMLLDIAGVTDIFPGV